MIVITDAVLIRDLFIEILICDMIVVCVIGVVVCVGVVVVLISQFSVPLFVDNEDGDVTTFDDIFNAVKVLDGLKGSLDGDVKAETVGDVRSTLFEAMDALNDKLEVLNVDGTVFGEVDVNIVVADVNDIEDTSEDVSVSMVEVGADGRAVWLMSVSVDCIHGAVDCIEDVIFDDSAEDADDDSIEPLVKTDVSEKVGVDEVLALVPV